MEVAYVDVKNGGLAVRQITSLNRYLDSGLDYGLDYGLLYLLHLICSLSLFRFRQWPTFFCHGRVKPPFVSGFQYNLNNEFLFLQNKKGWNASYIHEVLNELWEFMGMSIYAILHKCSWNFEYTEKCNPKTMVESGMCVVQLR